MCDGKKSIPQIAVKLSEKLHEPITEEFVWLAIDQLKKEDLLINVVDIKTEFDGLSRREVIRKIGFASMIALPVVSSLVAPKAANAQSCLGIGENIGSSIACLAAGPPCSCSTVIGGHGVSACCPGLVAIPGTCVPIPMTTSQQCACLCGVVIP